LIVLVVHFITTVLRIAQPGGLRSVIAESVLIKHQLLILNRSRRRVPNLRVWDRLIVGFCSLWIKPNRLLRSPIAFKPSTLLNFHRALVQRKYRLLFSPKHRAKPGPKGPDQDLIGAVVDMKKRNPRWGCPRIAKQIELAFGIPINKDVVRRILAAHYHPSADGTGPGFADVLGTRHYDQYTRRIIGFGIHAGMVDGWALCRMFNRATRWQTVPKYLSSDDHDPLYRFHQWQANLRVLGVTEIKTVPFVPLSHPFVERLIGTIRRECLDHLLFWTAADLEMKLSDFQNYYNHVS
jgi:putative transposase